MDQYITTRPIMDICLAVEWWLGVWVSQQWREKDDIELDIGVGRPVEWEMEAEREEIKEREAA